MAERPTVFVVDDDAGALRSMCWLIQEAGLPVRAFGSGREFLDSSPPADVGCVVLDMRMPEMDGLEVQQELSRRGSMLPVIFLTAFGDVAGCAAAFKAGAIEFLEKPVDDRLLLQHIRTALTRAAGKRRSPSVAQFAQCLNRLTRSEKDVLDLLISGKTLKEIAKLRNVTVQTIWRHRLSLLEKFRVENNLELIRLATLWAAETPNGGPPEQAVK